MAVSISRERPDHPEAQALLIESQNLMAALFDKTANHALGLDALRAPHIHFFVACNDDQIVGTAALAIMSDYAEVKSVFVAPSQRGLGIAERLMEALEADAVASGRTILRLETGWKLKAACRLYERCGFSQCPSFGTYSSDPASVFYEKRLTSGG